MRKRGVAATGVAAAACKFLSCVRSTGGCTGAIPPRALRMGEGSAHESSELTKPGKRNHAIANLRVRTERESRWPRQRGAGNPRASRLFASGMGGVAGAKSIALKEYVRECAGAAAHHGFARGPTF